MGSMRIRSSVPLLTAVWLLIAGPTLADENDEERCLERDFADALGDEDRCTLLFNASINLEQARLAGRAIEVREQLLERYPTCELAAQTSFHLAHAYHALTMHREALEQYEDFAAKYPKERLAIDALINAFELRLAFDEYDAAAANLHRFERNYARREPAEAAMLSLHFGLRLLEAGRHRQAREHLESSLKRYARVLQPEQRIRAEVALADTYWEQPRPNRKAAIASYRRVVGRLEGGAVLSMPAPGAADASAKARYRLALVEYEKLAAIELPPFRPRKRVPPKIARWWKRRNRDAEPDVIQFEHWAEHQFRSWLRRQTEALDTTTRALRAVAELRSPRWTIAAAARSGDAHWRLAETLAGIGPPPSLAADEQVAKVFREALQHHIERPREMALQAYEHCHRVAQTARWFGPEALHCQRRLAEIDPEGHPPLDELLPASDTGEPTVLPLPEPLLERAEQAIPDDPCYDPRNSRSER
jgi:tetratricopeptide (TPR) repeat protein